MNALVSSIDRHGDRQGPPERALEDHLIQLVTAAVDSAESKRSYAKAVRVFCSWWWMQAAGFRDFNRALVLEFKAWDLKRGSSAASVNLRLAAIRKLASEAATAGHLEPERAAQIGSVPGVRARGRRAGNWLTKSSAEKLLRLPDRATLKGARDRAILMTFLGCGLRRSEVATLRCSQVQQREGRWVFLDVLGKGNVTRTVAMPGWTKVSIDEWLFVRGQHHPGFCRRDPGEARLFITLSPNGQKAGELSARALGDIVLEYGRKLGESKLGPHDLRRTFAKLAEKGNARLNQIQLSLGHASIETTEVYLGSDLDLSDAPCDHLGLDVSA